MQSLIFIWRSCPVPLSLSHYWVQLTPPATRHSPGIHPAEGETCHRTHICLTYRKYLTESTFDVLITRHASLDSVPSTVPSVLVDTADKKWIYMELCLCSSVCLTFSCRLQAVQIHLFSMSVASCALSSGGDNRVFRWAGLDCKRHWLWQALKTEQPGCSFK